MRKALMLATMLTASIAHADITTNPVVVAPTEIAALMVDKSIIEIKFLEADTSSWVVPQQTVDQICSGTAVQINGAAIKDLIIKIDGDLVVVGGKTANYNCPLSANEIIIRDALAAQMVEYAWSEDDQKAALAAFDARYFAEVLVQVSAANEITVDQKPGFDLRESPYGKRWTEGNLFYSYIRDEVADGKATLIRLDLADRRIFILTDDCGGIAKVSVGIKPVVKVKTKKATSAKPAKPKPAQTPARHDPYRVECGVCKP